MMSLAQMAECLGKSSTSLEVEKCFDSIKGEERRRKTLEDLLSFLIAECEDDKGNSLSDREISSRIFREFSSFLKEEFFEEKTIVKRLYLSNLRTEVDFLKIEGVSSSEVSYLDKSLRLISLCSERGIFCSEEWFRKELSHMIGEGTDEADFLCLHVFRENGENCTPEEVRRVMNGDLLLSSLGDLREVEGLLSVDCYFLIAKVENLLGLNTKNTEEPEDIYINLNSAEEWLEVLQRESVIDMKERLVHFKENLREANLRPYYLRGQKWRIRRFAYLLKEKGDTNEIWFSKVAESLGVQRDTMTKYGGTSPYEIECFDNLFR